ncbi:uncharacterized protein LOC121718897 isoform X1 [Alosa sapidissima]|uniref:uncharacterized protein LOC121718897 isoform X1 n=1 Tax=Alosa sapidissima TaxID=34773 RepID=UPI001C08B106|nr:uncharacterized protein LOC121718897 isoform X1 [Alosa sapidissima]XP_041960248.1 uncharacterized protein LOC121718897 isoform X1 [Alosa sapidissima]
MDSIEKALQTVLPQLDQVKLETLVNELLKVGVEGPGDLQFIQEDDIKHLLTPIQCRKIIHSLKGGPTNPQLSPSSPEPLSVASSSTCPISPISPISAWVNSFEVPWNKVRATLRRAVDAGERPAPDDRRHLIRVIVDAMREHSLNPTRRECMVVAKAITEKYPNSFLDKNEEGELIGCGYFSVINQLKIRVEYVNRGNTLSRLRKHKRTQRDDGDGDDDQPAVATCARVDSYGCVRWQPEDYPDGETSASLEEKKLEMLDIFSQEGLKGAERGRVEDLMAITYAKQREYINANPSPSILDVGKEWPFLFSQKFLLSHFTTLTNVELYTRLNEDLDKKGKRILDFFSSQITKWRKEVRAVLKEALKKDREGTDGLAAMLVMLAHFKEQEESLFLLADVTTTPADAEAQLSLPITPRIIMLGETILTSERWMLSIEGRVVIPPSADFTSALATLFACFYVFNLEYQVEASTTLEFVQRFLVRINPDSSKCTAKEQISKMTGRVVKRKTTYMNPSVLSFIRDFTEFYLLD